jgi:hypothetical protein
MVRRRRKGQQLITCALFISILVISTQAYIYRMGRSSPSPAFSYLADYALGFRQGSRHAVVASLANVSTGGPSSSMVGFLDRWEAFAVQDYRFGICSLNATPASQAPYSGGTRFNWGTSGVGVSSAYSDFTLNISGRGADVDMDFGVNVTTKVELAGSYVDLGDDRKELSVKMDMINEGQPALAGSRTLEYKDNSEPGTFLVRPTAADDTKNAWDAEPSGWDGDNGTSAVETLSRVTDDIYWITWNNTATGDIIIVDLRIRLDFVITSQARGSDSVTVEWWVGAQQGLGTYTIDSTNDAQDIVVSFDDVSEPNDGSWSWADVGNIEIRLDGTKNGGFDTIIYAVDEVWGWVTVSGGIWHDASHEENFSETDYGNGTYAYSVILPYPGSQIEVRMQAYDRRGVFVQAEVTLNQE